MLEFSPNEQLFFTGFELYFLFALVKFQRWGGSVYIHTHMSPFADGSPPWDSSDFPQSCRGQNNWQKPTLPLALLLTTHTRTEWWSLAIIPSGFPPLMRGMSHNLFSELKVLGCTFELKAALKELLVPVSLLIFRNHGCPRGVSFLCMLLTLL